MTKPDLFIDGMRLDLVNCIGKGGEGEVYLLAGDQKKVVKVYKDEKRTEREAKVRAMVKLGLAQGYDLVAFPEATVTTKSGQFVGFTMRLADGFWEIHQLYGPKSRKIHYPKADYRFLVRTATNAARAVGQVHDSQCVIGDLNHSGLLVSKEATVALIDADSFQFETTGKTYPCLVAVPDFTPPELQGSSLEGKVRTKAHDYFGLGVVVFQLLFMGRHPYAGQQKGTDLTLDKAIAHNLFAYTRRRSIGIMPPGAVATLDDFPADIADAFERAFGLEPEKRPSALEWVGLLQNLENRLVRCATNSMHYYPLAAKTCPWCKMEGASGAILFLSPFIANAAVGLGNFDIEKVWLAIKAVVLPDPQTVAPKLPALGTQASTEAKSAKSGTVKDKVIGLVIAAAAVALWVNAPEGFVLWIGGLILAWFRFNTTSFNPTAWRNRYSAIDTQWDESLAEWRNTLGIANLVKLRADLERAVQEYRGLGSAKAQAIARLKNERYNRQLDDYLDRFLISRASIAGIGPAKTVTLASFGIESAADIKTSVITQIPGFGIATANKLLSWRAQYERQFVYNPAPLPSDLQVQAKVEAEFSAKAARLAKQVSGGQAELVLAANRLQTRLRTENSRLSELAKEQAQVETDLIFLGVSKPYKAATTQTSVYRPAPLLPPLPSSKTQIGSTGTCPSCGSPMVQRVAKRGYRRGKMFWGCSRYPLCRATRN